MSVFCGLRELVSGMLTIGAKNTINKRHTAPDSRGFAIYRALVAGCTPGIQDPRAGNTGWPTCCGFLSSRREPCLRYQVARGVAYKVAYKFFSGLRSRSNKEGSDAMFLASLFPATRNGVAA